MESVAINASVTCVLYLTALYHFQVSMINVTEITHKVNSFFCFDSLRPSQQHFSHVRMDLSALNQY